MPPLIVVAAAIVMYQLAHDSVLRSVQTRLETVATLKRTLVHAWIADAMNDLRVTVESPALTTALQEWHDAAPRSAEGPKQRLVDLLWRVSRVSHYAEIGVRDGATGELLLTTTGDTETPQVRRDAMAAAGRIAPLLEDFHANGDRGPKDTLFLGLFCGVGLRDGVGRYVIHVAIDPRRELFPLIDLTPATESSEVLLLNLRPDAMHVVNAANEAGSGVAVRFLSMASPHALASKLAQARGHMVEGLDDRGRPTLAYALDVEGAPWIIAAAVERDVALAELHRIALIGASLLVVLLLAGAWWWVEQDRRARAQQAHQAERAAVSRRMVAAQEEERQRWSAELHDRTGANLAAINMNLKAIAKAIPQPDAEDHELLSETSALIGDTIVSIRDFCNALRPALLEYAGLVPALHDAAERFARRTGAQTRFDHAAFDGRCDAETELMLFRITQEALLNCAKHARARHVAIVLSGTPQRLALRIDDDGVGFDTNLVSAGRPGIGQGLLNMRERALFAGGTLEIVSAPGEGTRVIVELGTKPRSAES